MYAPWWLYKEQLAGKLGFARGYHIEFGGGRRHARSWARSTALEWLTGGSYGRKFKRRRAALLRLVRRISTARGEMIPNEHSYCEIDPRRAGPVGHPGPALPLEVVEHETPPGGAHAEDLWRDHRGDGRARDAAQVLIRRRQGDRAGRLRSFTRSAAPSWERDAENSVTNRWGQTWDVEEPVRSTDGARFASNADKNPTLTIMALAWRAADRILDRMRRKEL